MGRSRLRNPQVRPIPAVTSARPMPCSEEVGPPQMGGQVPIPQAEPARSTIGLQPLQAIEVIPRDPPAPGGIDFSRKGIGDGVQVRTDPEPTHLEIVPGVADDGDPLGVE